MARPAPLAPLLALLLSLALSVVASAQSSASFRVIGWGENASAQANPPPGPNNEFVEVAAGDGHSLALRIDGTIVAWGRNDFGQATVPTSVRNVTAIAAGANHSIAVINSRTLAAWGRSSASAIPGTIQTAAQNGFPDAIAAGTDFSLVLLAGTVLAWGDNALGQTNVPAGLTGVVAIAAGEDHALALRRDGSVVAWGHNDAGQCTIPASAQRINAIAAGRKFSAAIRADGTVIVWGRGADDVFAPPPAADGAQLLRAGRDHLVAVFDRQIITWGENTRGQLAPPPVIDRPVLSLAAGGGHTLAVLRPRFTRHPDSQSFRPGDSVTLSGETTDLADLTFEWRIGNALIGAAPAPSFTYTPPANSDTLTVRMIALYRGAAVAETRALLHAQRAPLIVSPSSSHVASESQPIQLEVHAIGSGELRYQWFKNGVPIPDATRARLDRVLVDEPDAGDYVVEVANAHGTTRSPVLTVRWHPPAAAAGFSGSSSFLGLPPGTGWSFGAPHYGTPPYTYRWFKDGALIPGAIGPNYRISALRAADQGEYRVEVTDSTGNFQQVTTRLEVASPLVIRAFYPSPTFLNYGNTATLRVEAESSVPLTYEWIRLGAVYGTGPVFTTSVSPTTTGAYKARVGNGRMTAETPEALITVMDPVSAEITRRRNRPYFQQLPATHAARPGETVTYTVEARAIDGQPVSYAWLKNNTPILGATGPTLALRDVTRADAAEYTVRATAPGMNEATTSTHLRILAPPEFRRQPQDFEFTNAGEVVTFTAEIDAGPAQTIAYELLRDGVTLPGFTKSDSPGFVLSEPRAGAAFGNYQIRVTTEFGSTLSHVVRVRPRQVPLEGIYLVDEFALGVFGALHVKADRSLHVSIFDPSARILWQTDTVLDSANGFVVRGAVQMIDGEQPLARNPLVLQGTLENGVARLRLEGSSTLALATRRSATNPHPATGVYELHAGGTEGARVFVGADGRAYAFLRTSTVVDMVRGAFDPGRLEATLSGSSNNGSPFAYIVNVDAALGSASIRLSAFDNPSLAVLPALRARAADAARLGNLSVRALASTGDGVLITGFVIEGTASKRLLVRAAGPALANFGLASPVPDPQLEIYRGSTRIAQNDDWSSHAAALTPLFADAGAFAFPTGSKDSALVFDAPPGAYTAQILSNTGATGVALAEIYDLSANTSRERLVNLATRGRVGSADQLVIQGFVIAGPTPKRVLIRAVGPTLARFDVGGTLANPRLRIYQGDRLVAENDDWSANFDTGVVLEHVAAQVGAFPLTRDSRDAALFLSLAPGAYTAQVDGASGATGIALVEVYEVSN